MQFWGRMASGILFVCEGEVFLHLRSADVADSGTWGIPGGALKDGWYNFPVRSKGVKPPSLMKRDFSVLWESAIREVEEEVGYFPEDFKVVDRIVNWVKNTNFPYVTFIVEIPVHERQAIIEAAQGTQEEQRESEDSGWFSNEELPENIHHGVEYVLNQWKTQ